MMKSKIILLILVLVTTHFQSYSQTIDWVFAQRDSTAESCSSMTDCSTGEVCYFIEFTPSITGTMTSYTLGFIGNCLGNLPVTQSQSCVINDNSSSIDACAVLDSFLFQASGNGNVDVVANVPITIHQVCFQLNDLDTVVLKKDPILNLTANIDSINSSNSYTELIEFTEIELTNDVCDCFRLDESGGASIQNIDCLTPLTTIKYNLFNCDTAMVSGLVDGLSSVLINGVINIEGSPQKAGTFTFTISSLPDCDCEDATGTITVDSSGVMINDFCYTKVEDAILDVLPGQEIDIFENLTTAPGLLLQNRAIRVHPNVIWRIE